MRQLSSGTYSEVGKRLVVESDVSRSAVRPFVAISVTFAMWPRCGTDRLFACPAAFSLCDPDNRFEETSVLGSKYLSLAVGEVGCFRAML